jgi:hypothetical protein
MTSLWPKITLNKDNLQVTFCSALLLWSQTERRRRNKEIRSWGLTSMLTTPACQAISWKLPQHNKSCFIPGLVISQNKRQK